MEASDAAPTQGKCRDWKAQRGPGVLVVDGPRYRFRHELVRQAVVEQLAPHRRIEIHRETALRLLAWFAPRR